MGVLNITPDSFSDGGKYNKKNKAIEHASKMYFSGANLIDIGGEIIISGNKHGDPWNIGIQNPLSDIDNSTITINNSDHNFLAIATSGEYIKSLVRF